MKSGAIPKISCLTITADRLVLLKQAIACYCDQTYPNRELVIVTAGAPRYQAAVADHLRYLGRDDLHLVCLEQQDFSLGALRNVSLDHARGELMCQWDDDDLHHPERLRLQMEAMTKAGAQGCYLTDYLQFLSRARTMYWINWNYLYGAEEEQQMVPQTVLAYRDPRFRYNESGHDSRTGEDNAFRKVLCNNFKITSLRDCGYLYVYRWHGRNIAPQHHHECIRAWGGTESGYLNENREALCRALPYYRLPMPYTVKARSGQDLFTFNG
jgi:glycosyltransferase involved in cell wall biosynthesis